MEEERHYSLSELKSLSRSQQEEIMAQYHVLRVPVSAHQNAHLHFRKLLPYDPSTPKNRSKAEPLESKSTLSNSKNAQRSTISLSLIKQKVIENPMEATEAPQDITAKIFENLPSDRTLLVVCFDKGAGDVGKIFSRAGKIRRVFCKTLVRPGAPDLLVHLIVFKDFQSILTCFDTEKMHWGLHRKVVEDMKMMGQLEKDKRFKDYMGTVEAYLPKAEEVEEMGNEEGDDGFVQVHSNFEKWDEEWKDFKPPKKRKPKDTSDFYAFKGKAQPLGCQAPKAVKTEDFTAGYEEESDLDEKKLEDPDYLAKRKRMLQNPMNKKIKKSK